MFIFARLIQRIFWGSWYSNEPKVEEFCPLYSLFFRCHWRWVCHLQDAGNRSTNPCFNRHRPRLRTKLHLACRSSAFLSRTHWTFSLQLFLDNAVLSLSIFNTLPSVRNILHLADSPGHFIHSFFHPFRADWVLTTLKQCAVTFQQGDSQEASTHEQNCCYQWVLRTGEQGRDWKQPGMVSDRTLWKYVFRGGGGGRKGRE